MRPWVHVLGILGGIAATAGFEGWTTSAHGPRSKAHYASVENASMTPQEIALAFERLACTEHQPQQAVDRFLAPQFTDHEPDRVSPGNRQSLLQQLTAAGAGAPLRTVEHVATSGDTVMVHYVSAQAGGAATAGVDIFRIADRKIQEHWGIAQSLTSR